MKRSLNCLLTIAKPILVVVILLSYGWSAWGGDDDYLKRRIGGDSYSWEDLVADFKSTKPKDGTALLAMLLQKAKSDFTLVYDSRSRHRASYQTPRIILAFNGGRLLVAFGTDPSDPLYEEVEAIETHDKPREFRPHSINFSEKNTSTKFDRPESVNECRQCHTSLHRPNWDSYPVWPGVFGSMSEGHVPEEEAQFQKLIQNENKNPRIAAIEPRLNNLNIRSVNTGLTEVVNPLVGEVVRAKYKRLLYPYRYALLYANSYRCWPRLKITDFLPPDLVEKHNVKIAEMLKKRGYLFNDDQLIETLIKDTTDAGNTYLNRKNQRIMKRFNISEDEYRKMNHEPRSFPYDGSKDYNYAYIRYILEGIGIPAGSIHPHFEKNTFVEGLGGLGIYGGIEDEEYDKLPPSYTFSNKPEEVEKVERTFCEKIRDLSLKALAERPSSKDEDRLGKQGTTAQKPLTAVHSPSAGTDLDRSAMTRTR